MATKKITFDPEAGVAYPCDLIMNVGADFNAKFNIVDTANTGFNFLQQIQLVSVQQQVGQDHLR